MAKQAKSRFTLFVLMLLALATLGLVYSSSQTASAQKELPEHPPAPESVNAVPSFRVEFVNPAIDGDVQDVQPVSEYVTSGDWVNLGIALTELEAGLNTDDMTLGWEMPLALQNLETDHYNQYLSGWGWDCLSPFSCSRTYDIFSGPSLYIDYSDIGGDTTPFNSARLVRFNLVGFDAVDPGCYTLAPLTAQIEVYRNGSYVFEEADQRSVVIRHEVPDCNTPPPPTPTPPPSGGELSGNIQMTAVDGTGFVSEIGDKVLITFTVEATGTVGNAYAESGVPHYGWFDFISGSETGPCELDPSGLGVQFYGAISAGNPVSCSYQAELNETTPLPGILSVWLRYSDLDTNDSTDLLATIPTFEADETIFLPMVKR